MADTSISTFSDDEQDTAPQEPDPDYESELLEVCSGLGATKENEEGEERFDRGDREECLYCVRALQRYLRRDGPQRMSHRHLGKWKVLQTKLIPLVRNYRDDEELTFAITKLVVMLTMPPEELSEAIEAQSEHLVRYKEAFVKRDGQFPDGKPRSTLHMFFETITDPLSRYNIADRDRDPSVHGKSTAAKDKMKIELVLTLFRNLLHVKNPGSKVRSIED